MGLNYYSPLKPEHNTKYDDTPRLDIADLISQGDQRVLEIGCSTGATGRLLKQKFPNMIYEGVELDESAAAIAAARLDNVIAADMERSDLAAAGIEKGAFDAVIFADVLEHLYDPWKALYTVRDFLKPDGKVIASIPNVQNIHLVLHLLKGNWSYDKYGLLDATHVRFFTMNEIIRLFNGTRYRIAQCINNIQPEFEYDGWPRDLDFGNVLLKDVTFEEAVKLYTVQYLIVARKTG
ncbi:MAG: class I SAM-dependent methyltransferase [Nitrospirae bacterium]|nr:MAG: class I SAM-dependent methyltransferase [Nitrospirota bacterium]